MLTRNMLIQGLPVLRTERLVLRSLRQSDYSPLTKLLSDPQVIRYVNRGSQSPPVRARKLLNQIQSSGAKLDSLHYGICYKGSERVIGIVSFQHWNDQKGTAQIGYILNKLHWGKGLATEAVHRLLTFGFDELHLWRVEARCYEANLPSERVLCKMGMLYERILPAFGLNDDDGEADECTISLNVKVYGLCRGQFQSVLGEKRLHSSAYNPEIL